METDIFEIPLYYISFNKKDEINQHYKNVGFKNITHFKAINGKKLDPEKLIKDNIISVRTYDDLYSGRSEHSGIPGFGAIGCSLSHYELWNVCVKQKLPFIIIAEEDNRICGEIPQDKIEKIQEILSKPKSIFISIDIQKEDHRKHFFGTHFYIASKSACEELIKGFFPIDVQVDWYIGHKSTTGSINLEGFPISKQTTPMGKSSIQTSICFKCILPKSPWFYIALIFVIIIMFLSIYIYRKKYIGCEQSCSKSE